jgi:hypothetical protein
VARVVVVLVLFAVAALGATAASAHVGGRYGTVGDMETSLNGRGQILQAVCTGAGLPHRPPGAPKILWQYKHFRCLLFVNVQPYSRCALVHVLATGRIAFTDIFDVDSGRRCL